MKFKIVVLLASLLGMQTAAAQVPSFYNLTDSQGVQYKIATFNCRTTQLCLESVPSDYNGFPLAGPVGTTNPNGTAQYVQGVTGGIPIPTTIGGTLPAFATTPSFNISGLNGAAPSLTNPFFVAPGTGSQFHIVCDSGCSTSVTGNVNLNQILGAAPSGTNPLWVSPATGATFPISGNIGNSSFGISGTLPAFAATPTVNCGTGCYQATQPVVASGSTGTDASANASAIPSSSTFVSLTSVPVNSGRASVTVQNQSAITIQIVRDNGSGGQQSSIFLPGPFGNWTSTTFKGRLTIYGPSGAQVAAFQD